jgi:Synergist-CTERM protein sorting domain-containing protein
VSARRAASALALLATLATLAAASPAAAFVRSTTSASDPTANGYCLWWGTRAVTYQINAEGYDSVPGCSSAAAAADLARSSFPAWAVACTDFHFVDGGTTTERSIGSKNGGLNLVVFRRGACSDPGVVPTNDACHSTAGACATLYNCWEHDASGSSARTIALTTTTFRTADGQIIDADMELFGWTSAGTVSPPLGWYFTCADAAACPSPPYGRQGCVSMDVGTTVVHEAGHMLGLDHVCQYDQAHGGTSTLPSSTCALDSVMLPTARLGIVHRSLAADDRNAVCAIYPAGQAADKSNGCYATPPPQQSPMGCGSAGAGPLALLALAPLALRARRRRASTPAR